jgi:putative radical SAM enzyme (TIGR03279 family)
MLRGMVRIAEVVPGTIADELQLEIGSRIVRINGDTVRDGIDFRLLESDPFVEVEIATADGCAPVVYEIEKDAGEPLGIVPAADAVRQCANKCVFCFIDGNPPRARQALYLKDDDFRLSFTYGSYVTLTNLGPKGFRRLIEQRLSPLYVSVHATEPEVRMRLLGVPRDGEIMHELRELIDGGLEVHTQVVLCPEWNNGAHLDRTLDDLWSLGPGVLSLSVVPVGLTRYNLDRPVRLLAQSEAAAAIRQVERARELAIAERGRGWAYAGDELFFIAGQPLPEDDYYDDWPLTENGVGAVRSFLDAFEAGLPKVPHLPAARIAVITGTRMVAVIEPLSQRLSAHTRADVRTLAVDNHYFGPTVNTAGLLAGTDILNALGGAGGWDAVLLPAESLNDEACFIDDMHLDVLAAQLAPARVVTGHDLTEAVCRL